MCDIGSLKTAIESIDLDNDSRSIPDHLSLAQPTLLNLPVEIFLKICSFLDADFISETLSKVCYRFKDILDDVLLWKYWVNRRITNTYPVLPHLTIWNEEDLNWRDTCIEIDREYKKWTNVEKTMTHVVVKDVHFASIDAVLLANSGEICISGGRDRVLALWKVSSIKSHIHEENKETCVSAEPEKRLADAHNGWIWDLKPDNADKASIIYSASWDNTVKAWDLEYGFKNVQVLQCPMAALSIAKRHDLIYTGLFSRNIVIFDIRAGPSPINQYRCHNGPILSLDICGDKVASISEDKTLGVWDNVAGKVFIKDVKLRNIHERCHPVCINYSPAALYVGDSKGSIHLVDPEKFVNTATHVIWPEPQVTSPAHRVTAIHQGKGTMIVCSDRGEIKNMYNAFPPEQFMSVRSSTFAVTKMKYQNEVMVVGTCYPALEFWIPSERVSKF